MNSIEDVESTTRKRGMLGFGLSEAKAPARQSRNQRINFHIGRVQTNDVENTNVSPLELVAIIERHASGDWGDLGELECKANDAAVTSGNRIRSVFKLSTGIRISIVTVADRSRTKLRIAVQK
jgi:hypothetical protein